MHIEVFTDGSATTGDLPGGWAFVLVIDGKKHAECSGHMENASNNDAEMEAAIQGLAAVLKYLNEWVMGEDGRPLGSLPDAKVTLCSDSQLILGWASGRYRFKQAAKIEKFKQLQFLVKRLGVQTRWVKGHAGDEHNERCDKLANQARLGPTRKKEKEEAIATGKTLIGTKKLGTICVWYKNTLKIVDLETNVIEDYNRAIHGQRGGTLEVREEKSR